MPNIELTGTRKTIFNKATELFAARNYEAVTMKDIADAVGIQKPSLYAHYKSKQEILDTMFDFFCENFTVDRLSIEEIESIIQNGSVMDLINAVHYIFQGEKTQNLLLIYKIIQSAKFTNERAQIIAKELLRENGIKYVEDVFNRAVELGRLAPFDTHSLSLFINNNRLCFFFDWCIDETPQRLETLTKELDALNAHILTFITDLKPPL